MLDHSLSCLAVASVVALVFVLAYPSQYFLLSPYFTRNQRIFFNVLVACIWITYTRTVLTDPGSPPASWIPSGSGGLDAEEGRARGESRRLVASTTRWCKRCERFKPARCHHCKTCKKCVLKMDHHCPWTASCIGYRNLPHFLRFLFFATTTCAYLLLQLSYRALAIWNSRHLSVYYTPHSTPQMIFLFILLLIDTPLTLALLILLVRTIAQAGEGYTSIETWELERHHAQVRKRVVRRQVFPYDVGIWDNLVVAFGGVNGFEDPDLEWPPRDPEKEGRLEALKRSGAFTIMEDSVEFAEGIRQRLREDLLRRAEMRGGWGERGDMRRVGEAEEDTSAEWRNSDGERLADYGVDEELEEEDEDIPLAILMQRRKRDLERVGGVLGEDWRTSEVEVGWGAMFMMGMEERKEGEDVQGQEGLKHDDRFTDDGMESLELE
ncbi:DHHC palmitoyltransferase-domain-containing protein [Trichophaea hybrida]|nr:DHHC palmitoyltransferase-domain-containing protein [Trichophaea hybrida]